MRSSIVDRWAPMPGSRPGICCCVVQRGAWIALRRFAMPRVRRSHMPAPRDDERSIEYVERYGILGEPAVRRRIVRPVHAAIPWGPGGPKRKAA
jgi:hypothetical protein